MRIRKDQPGCRTQHLLYDRAACTHHVLLLSDRSDGASPAAFAPKSLVFMCS
uniref:Uncharacterized protein n=1 Tax=Anguilla anguilla TaxID=7936 RepID=A0A0E9V2W8_ANGAN